VFQLHLVFSWVCGEFLLFKDFRVSKRYRIGLIGAGARGETFARQLYKGTDQLELFGVCDIDEDRLAKFCDFCGLSGARRFTNPDEMLRDPTLDAVIVSTPEFTHAAVASAALRAGKHVYLEKPVAQNVADSHRILEATRGSDATLYVGFNMRAGRARQKLKEIVDSGVLGQIVYIEGLEQLSREHGASFMRRFHRHSKNSGGMMNTKCCHDLDQLLWLVGHNNRVARVASFGGCNVFTPNKKPAETCDKCPKEIYDKCAYKAAAGFVFPVSANTSIHHRDRAFYGGELCVYTDDKDLVDNQTVIIEWANGVRGSMNLQMFANEGVRRTRIFGEFGQAFYTSQGDMVGLTMADTGKTEEFTFPKLPGGHGGTDPLMLQRFIAAIERGDPGDSGIEQGLAATLLANKADEARLTRRVVEITAEDYGDSVGNRAGAVSGARSRG